MVRDPRKRALSKSGWNLQESKQPGSICTESTVPCTLSETRSPAWVSIHVSFLVPSHGVCTVLPVPVLCFHAFHVYSHRRSPTSASGNTSCRSFGALIPASVAHCSNWSSPRSLPVEVALLLLLCTGVSSARTSALTPSNSTCRFHGTRSRSGSSRRATQRRPPYAGWPRSSFN